MCLLVDVEEAAERLEELIEFARRGDDVLLCRGDRPIAVLSAPVAGDARSTIATGKAGIDTVWDLATEGRRPPAPRSSAATSVRRAGRRGDQRGCGPEPSGRRHGS